MDTNNMKAVHLDKYVQDLAQISVTTVPRPSFSSYLIKLESPPTEPLLHILITHTAINHVDLLYAHGTHQNNRSGLFKPPFTLGLEFSGIVFDVWTPSILHHESRSVNAASRRSSVFKPGDRVWAGHMGSHAEEVIIPVSAAHHIPSGRSLSDMAAFGAATLPVAYGALTMIADIKPGETVLVHAAAGGLGVYAVQIVRALGGKVIATVGENEEKQRVVRKLLDGNEGMRKGEGVVCYADQEWYKKVVEICKTDGKRGVDVVFDTVGVVNQSIRCAKFGGRIVVVGFAARTGTGEEKVQELENVPVNRILLKQIKLLGYRYGETARSMPREHGKVWDGLQALLVRDESIRPILYGSQRKELEAVPNLMKDVQDRKVYGKAVVEVQSEEAAFKRVQSSSRLASKHRDSAML